MLKLSKDEYTALTKGSYFAKKTKPLKAKKAIKAPSEPSKLESSMMLQIKLDQLPEPVSEYKFHLQRKWRFDFAWPELKIALELEGGTYSHGRLVGGVRQKSRHLTGVGFYNDARKYNAAAALGWLVVKADSKMVTNGDALSDLHAVFQGVKKNEF